jgi:hypothetical protein
VFDARDSLFTTVMSDKYRFSEASSSNYRRMPPLVVLFSLVAALTTAIVTFNLSSNSTSNSASRTHRVPLNAHQILAQCRALKTSSGPTAEFFTREVSDRFEPGTNATLIRNATIWTGEKNGTVIVHGDLLLDKGIVKAIGDAAHLVDNIHHMKVVDANGSWITPGLGEEFCSMAAV